MWFSAIEKIISLYCEKKYNVQVSITVHLGDGVNECKPDNWLGYADVDYLGMIGPGFMFCLLDYGVCVCVCVCVCA